MVTTMWTLPLVVLMSVASPDAGVVAMKDRDSKDEQHSPVIIGSGDATSFLVDQRNSSQTKPEALLQHMMGQLEQLTVQVHNVEQLIKNQTIDLRSTLHHDMEKMYGDRPQNMERGNKKEKGYNKKSHHRKDPFVFHSDETSHFRFHGENSSLHEDFKGWCDANHVAGFGPPKTHSWLYEAGADLGAWLKDPYPAHRSERTQIWMQRRATHVDDSYNFRRFLNYSAFRAGEESEHGRRRNHQRAWWIHGLGSVIYRGVIYFHYQNHLYRHDPHTDDRLVQLLMTSDYTRGQHTYVRYHADEFGLFVSYPQRDRFRLMLSRLDPDTLALSDTVTLDKDISRVKGIWMTCGKVYLLYPSKSLTGTGNHVARAVYDVTTKRPLIGHTHDVELLYGYVSQMTYNPREKVIFGWDNYHLLTWPVVWKKEG